METIDKNLDKLSQLLVVLNEEHPTKEEFLNAFKNIIDLVVKIEKRNSEAVGKIEQTYSILLNKFQNDHTASLEDLKKQTNELFVGKQIEMMKKEHTERMSFLTQKMKKVDARMAKVKDGYTPIKGKDYFDGRDGRFFTNEQINKMINEAINPVMDEFQKIWDDKIQRFLIRKNALGGGARQYQYVNEIPSGSLNGSNTTFYLITEPRENSLILTINGVPQRRGSGFEYTLAGKKITMTVAPLSTDTIFAYYTKF